jgi:hypothetical protein
MMATSVSSEATGPRPLFLPGASRRLFDTHSPPPNGFVWTYDVTSDGTRFLLASPVDTLAPPLNVVVNWTACAHGMKTYGEVIESDEYRGSEIRRRTGRTLP